MFRKGGRVSVETRFGAHHFLRAGDDADTLVSEGEQMSGGDHATGPIVRLYGQCGRIRVSEWVEQNEGNAAGMQFVPFDAGQVGENEDGAGDLPAQHVVDPGRVGMPTVAALRGDDAEVMQFGFPNGAAHDFQGPDVIEVLEDDFDEFLFFAGCRLA